jgi:hypothetical protein
MYTTMWSLDFRFDTKFFAISICMLVYLRVNVVHQFTVALRNFVHYIAAQKRIEVGLNTKIYNFIYLERNTS